MRLLAGILIILMLSLGTALSAQSQGSVVGRDAVGSASHNGDDAGGDSGDLSSLSPSQILNVAAEPAPDLSGVSGSNVPATSYSANGSSLSTSTTNRSRLYHTGVNGIEPTMAVARNGTIFAESYVQQQLPGGNHVSRPAVLRSTDGGSTWQDVSPMVNGVPVHANTQDPYLYMDQTTQRLFFVDFVGCYQISFSDNYGASWTNDAPLCGWNMDHQTLYAGPAPAGSAPPVGYPNVVYLCSIGGGLATPSSVDSVCSKSLDGGFTWVPTGTPAYEPNPQLGQEYGTLPWCDGATGHIFVDSRGYLYVPRGVCGQPWLAISRDEGATWTHVQVATNGMGRDDSGMADHEAAVRVDSQGNIYYAWVARDRIPYLAISRDGGVSWSDPIRAAPPNLKEADLPTMALGAPGKLELGYMGSTNSPGYPFPNDSECDPNNPQGFLLTCPDVNTGPYANVTFNGYITYTTNALSNNPTFTSATINDPSVPLVRGTCGPFRCQAEYDFIDVEIGPDGSPYEEAIAGCDTTQCYALGEAVVGRLVGGPNLH